MADVVELKRNYHIHEGNLLRLRSYNHLYSSQAFKNACDAQINETLRMMQNIEKLLGGRDV